MNTDQVEHRRLCKQARTVLDRTLNSPRRTAEDLADFQHLYEEFETLNNQCDELAMKIARSFRT